MFRSSFAVTSGLTPLAEEIRIVRAYLEIEQLRLGPKLSTKFDIDESVLSVEVPVFSIQPLVENAIKHGVACRESNGFVHIDVRREEESIIVSVSNSGMFRQPGSGERGHGIGMANVERRLDLCFGTGKLDVSSIDNVTTDRVPRAGTARLIDENQKADYYTAQSPDPSTDDSSSLIRHGSSLTCDSCSLRLELC